MLLPSLVSESLLSASPEIYSSVVICRQLLLVKRYLDIYRYVYRQHYRRAPLPKYIHIFPLLVATKSLPPMVSGRYTCAAVPLNILNTPPCDKLPSLVCPSPLVSPQEKRKKQDWERRETQKKMIILEGATSLAVPGLKVLRLIYGEEKAHVSSHRLDLFYFQLGQKKRNKINTHTRT